MTPLAYALQTALSVALHESADPDCTGQPPYYETQAQAASLIEKIMRTPMVQNALEEEAVAVVRSERFQQALKEVFEAPGEWGPAQGYYRYYLAAFTDALVVRLDKP